MIDLESVDHIYLYPGNTDLKKRRNTLGHMANEIAKNDKLHKIFIFCNSKEKLIKVYEKDTTGVWVYIRSLDSSKFGWPRNISEAKEINKSQLERLLKGLQYINFSSKNTDYNCY